MRMDLVLEIMDVPGQLVSILTPIGDLGANIVTVTHRRENKNEKGMIPVQLTLEGERDNLNAVIDKFNEMDITILEKDGLVNKERFTAILYGHMIDSDVRDTVDRINSVEGLLVADLQIKLDGEDESTSLVSVEFDSGLRDLAYSKFMEIANEKNFLVIDEV
ncbi:MAG: amino acid-binding protein [archaeon]|nr:amino acid-binding protein [archaeon]